MTKQTLLERIIISVFQLMTELITAKEERLFCKHTTCSLKREEENCRYAMIFLEKEGRRYVQYSVELMDIKKAASS